VVQIKTDDRILCLRVFYVPGGKGELDAPSRAVNDVI
jgi:hypothetical protein